MIFAVRVEMIRRAFQQDECQLWDVATEKVTRLLGDLVRVGRSAAFLVRRLIITEAPFALTEEFVTVYRLPDPLIPNAVEIRSLSTGALLRSKVWRALQTGVCWLAGHSYGQELSRN